MSEFVLSDWVGVISAAVSLLALGANLLITRRQTRISVESLKFNNDTQVMQWANRVVFTMSEAEHMIPLDGALQAGKIAEIAATLSALVDEGRWFFPNRGAEAHAPDKPEAYRGVRQAILDHVVEVYRVLEDVQLHGAGAKNGLVPRIVEARRHFVSEVQVAVDPRRRSWVLDRFKSY